MSTPRPVRIPRSAPSADVAPPTPGSERRFVPNTAGSTRAWRLFGMFAGFLVVIYLLFVGLAIASPSGGIRSNVAAWGVFTLVAAGFILVGWSITLGRAPRGAWWRDGEIVVQERLGRMRRFPQSVPTRVAQRYRIGLLGPEPTEFVELQAADGSPRTYLVAEGFFSPSRP